jgi:hypothetical protein
METIRADNDTMNQKTIYKNKIKRRAWILAVIAIFIFLDIYGILFKFGLYKSKYFRLYNLNLFRLLLIIAVVCGVQFVYYIYKWLKAKEAAGDEKVDKGLEFFYWNLSYRRKFIRDLWSIPFCVAVTILFMAFPFIEQHASRPFASYFSLIVLILVDIVGLPCSLIYNYKKWKKEESSKK